MLLLRINSRLLDEIQDREANQQSREHLWSMEIEAICYAHVCHIYLFLARQNLCEALRAQNTNTNSPILTIRTNLPTKGAVYNLR